MALYKITSTVKVNSTSTVYEAFNFTRSPTSEVPIEILLGPGGGCMKFDDEPRNCERTLTFRPSPSFLHLPPDETLTRDLPTMQCLIVHHVVLGMVLLGIVAFWLGPFLPGCYSISAAIMLLSAIFTFLFLLWGDIMLAAYLHDQLRHSVPKVKESDLAGGFLWIFLITVLMAMSTAIVLDVVSRITGEKPPEEGDMEMQDQESVDKM